MDDPRAKLDPTTLACELILLGWILLGVYGALWISDDLDELRMQVLAFGGIPLAFTYYGLWALRPDLKERWRKGHSLLAGLLALLFLVGVLPLVNAVTSDGKTVKRNVTGIQQLVTRDVRRGGLGMLYTTRW